MAVPTRMTRLSGSDDTPRWRGRLHLGALVLAIPAAIMLTWRDRTPAAGIYATALVALFAVSAGYHLLPLSRTWRSVMRRTDHAMIYVYIGAAYTPFCLAAVHGPLGWAVLAAVWTGALVGVAIKTVGFERTRAVSGALYMLMGWMAVVTLPAVLPILDAAELALFAAMGALYTGGAIVLATRKPDPVPHVFGYHELWHAAVVAASACYFAAMWGLPGLRHG